jgi:hypothetical protein
MSVFNVYFTFTSSVCGGRRQAELSRRVHRKRRVCTRRVRSGMITSQRDARTLYNRVSRAGDRSVRYTCTIGSTVRRAVTCSA